MLDEILRVYYWTGIASIQREKNKTLTQHAGAAPTLQGMCRYCVHVFALVLSQHSEIAFPEKLSCAVMDSYVRMSARMRPAACLLLSVLSCCAFVNDSEEFHGTPIEHSIRGQSLPYQASYSHVLQTCIMLGVHALFMKLTGRVLC